MSDVELVADEAVSDVVVVVLVSVSVLVSLEETTTNDVEVPLS